MTTILLFLAFIIFAASMTVYYLWQIKPYLFRIYYDTHIAKMQIIRTEYPVVSVQANPRRIMRYSKAPEEWIKKSLAHAISDELLQYIKFEEVENIGEYPIEVEKTIFASLRIVDERADFKVMDNSL